MPSYGVVVDSSGRVIAVEVLEEISPELLRVVRIHPATLAHMGDWFYLPAAQLLPAELGGGD